MIHGLGRVAALATGAAVLMLTACSPGGGSGDGSGQRPDATGSPGTARSSGPAAADDPCSHVPDLLVGAVQRYVDSYGTAVSGRTRSPATPAAGDTELENALGQTRDEIARRGCDVAAFQDTLERALDGVTSDGPLARAVLLRLQASLTGQVGSTAETRDVTPGDDLARVLARVGPGSTLRLAAGTYRLADTVVLLQGVTLRGVGRTRTVLDTTGASAGFLVLTDGRVELDGLALRHRGDAAASGLIGGPTSSVVLTGVRVSGARGGASGSGGGAGVLMSGRDGAEGGRGTTLEVTRSVFADNSGAGILLTGRHRASIRGSRFLDNGQCGVCFTGRSSGALRDSTLRRNAAGVAVLDRSRPLLADDRITGGQVGVQASGSSRPELRRVVVDGARRAAMIFGDTASGRVDGATCRNVRFGIVIGPRTYPELGTNDCEVAGTG